MNFKQFGNKFILRLDTGEEIVETVKKFCQDQDIKLGTIMGIGATDNVTVGLFDPQTKKYHQQILIENFEIAPLLGNISTMKGEIYLHLHINLCDQKLKCHGGHLNSATVSATFEAVIEKIAGSIDREFSEEIGLNLLKF